MNPNITTFMTYPETGPQTEKNTLPSLTQPDMTMSLQELLERHVRGLDVPQFVGDYEEEGEFTPDPRSLDLSDISRMREENLQQIEDLKTTAAAEVKTKKQKSLPKQQSDEGATKPDEVGKPSSTSDGQSSTDTP